MEAGDWGLRGIIKQSTFPEAREQRPRPHPAIDKGSKTTSSPVSGSRVLSNLASSSIRPPHSHLSLLTLLK